MSEHAELRKQIAGIFESMDLEAPPDVDLFDAGVLDSMVFVQLLLRLEETLQVTVSVDDLEIEDFRLVENIVQFVAKLRSAHRRLAS